MEDEVQIPKKPISLKEAARVLEARYPEWAFSERQLRTMAENGQIPTVMPPRGVHGRRNAKRSATFLVRVPRLLSCFHSWEKPVVS